MILSLNILGITSLFVVFYTSNVYAFLINPISRYKCEFNSKYCINKLPQSTTLLHMNMNNNETVEEIDIEVSETNTNAIVGKKKDDEKNDESLTSYQKAIKNYETNLQKELIYIESVLLSERNLLQFKKDQKTMSGKNGFYYIQAEVAEYQKKKLKKEKLLVKQNKYEFVMKILPVIDAFRAAPQIALPTNEVCLLLLVVNRTDSNLIILYYTMP